MSGVADGETPLVIEVNADAGNDAVSLTFTFWAASMTEANDVSGWIPRSARPLRSEYLSFRALTKETADSASLQVTPPTNL